MNGFEWLHTRHEIIRLKDEHHRVAFDRILDACLEDMRLNHASVESCLAKFPAQAADLCPLLEMAAALDSINSMGPTSRFRQATRRKVVSLPAPDGAPLVAKIAAGLRDLPTQLIATIATLLLLLTAAANVGNNSNSVLPGSPLYLVKRQVENIQLFFQTDRTSQALTHAAFADRRLEEARALASVGQTQLAEQATVEYGEQVALALENLRTGQREMIQLSVAQLNAQLQREQMELRQYRERAPQASRLVLEHALALSGKAMEQLAMITTLPTR